jgi:hypothetical protein
MSMEAAKSFLDAAHRTPELQEEVKKHRNSMVEVAAKYGYEFTAEELHAQRGTHAGRRRYLHHRLMRSLLPAAAQPETGTATLVLHPRAGASLPARLDALIRRLPRERVYLSPAEFEEACGASAEHVAEAAETARRRGLEVLESSAAERYVLVRGTPEQLAEPFPAHLVQTVLGTGASAPAAVAGAPAKAALTPADVAKYYQFPETSASGQKIGIVLPGGGFRDEDLQGYFAALGLEMPHLRVTELLGQTNDPAPREIVQQAVDVFEGREPLSPANLAAFALGLFTIEANMDVQLIGSFAPGADIHVYFAPDSFQGNYHALVRAIADPDGPSVISCSWSSHENAYPDSTIACMETLFQTAALKGVTLCFSSGDDGDGTLFSHTGSPVVHYPAASAYVLGCGGTSLLRSPRGWRAAADSAGRSRARTGSRKGRAGECPMLRRRPISLAGTACWCRG